VIVVGAEDGFGGVARYWNFLAPVFIDEFR
jgi:hypothetical protein